MSTPADPSAWFTTTLGRPVEDVAFLAEFLVFNLAARVDQAVFDEAMAVTFGTAEVAS